MFRFTIRDVLWLTVVVALGVGWWVDRREASDRADDLVRQVKERELWLYATAVRLSERGVTMKLDKDGDLQFFPRSEWRKLPR